MLKIVVKVEQIIHALLLSLNTFKKMFIYYIIGLCV